MSEIIQNELIYKIAANKYTTEILTDRSQYIRYFNTFGKTFFYLKEDTNKKDGITKGFETYRIKLSPYLLLRDNFVEDIDKILEVNYKKPDQIV